MAEANTSSGVEAKKVSKIYGRHRALSKVSLQLEPGTVTALLGPNGSGKTTLLMLFSTLSRPTSGEMRFFDLPKEKNNDARKHIGLLSHAPLTYGELTALENVAFFAQLYGAADPTAVAAAQLERFSLTFAKDRAARTFSRGMMQRLGLARALVGRPSLVLLDEPFTGLDRRSSEQVVDQVKALRESGATVLMISHDHATAAELGDRFVILKRGLVARQIDETLTADALRDQYAEVTEAGSAA